ncbi:hypothetical protein KDA11_04900, partial [Candidatus Saccharibacteria bacterium]|nr:hypothetical protein [Candidatus Saccharibacteria bacterium]
IAVAGSYGKTTIKELLATILAEGKNVKATPANKNVAVSHAKFAQKLSGKEDVLVIEYGEGQPGDVKKFAQTTNPSIGIITGLAPAHLDKYPSLDDVAEDIFSLADKVGLENTYINTDSPLIKAYAKQGYASYNSQGALGWMVSDVRISAHDTSFVMSKGKQRININSKLIGRHLVGPLALCVALAYKLGLNTEQIQAGTAKVTPYEHRMQPRLLAGAWVIDDTYNGNLEGIRAGLALLSELKAKRKIYVTPGLVDQGAETQKVHIEIGELIAKANPDRVILMDNSVTKWIHRGLTKMGYKGELIIQDDPLAFYSNLDQVVATGDVVLMQNDWTDNYN